MPCHCHLGVWVELRRTRGSHCGESLPCVWWCVDCHWVIAYTRMTNVRHVNTRVNASFSESCSGYYETKTSQLTYTAEVNWKSWFEWDLNSHLRDTDPPLYLLSYQVHRAWRRVFIQFNLIVVATISRALKLDKNLVSNPCGLDSSVGRAENRYPEGASLNPAWVNIFQLTSAM